MTTYILSVLVLKKVDFLLVLVLATRLSVLSYANKFMKIANKCICCDIYDCIFALNICKY